MTLPNPDSTALAHSEKLTRHIHHIIQDSGGSISFARFMELALYTPGMGYYSAGTHKLGKEGDFVTAPEISPLFAKCVAHQCQQIFSAISTNNILELGAGSGIFAKELLIELEKLDNLPENYLILEVSAELRERQQQLLKSSCPTLFHRVQWLDSLPKDFSGVIFANEVIDAMPVHCFRYDDHDIKERSVCWDQNNFSWCLTPPSKELSSKIQIIIDENALSPGFESEINLMISGWIRALGETIKKGVILLFDYGYGRSEYYHPDRQQGTLMCFYQHRQSTNPFQFLGLQDITAHVDFTSVIENAVDSGLSLSGYTTQGSFLLASGLLEIAHATSLSEIEKFKQNQAIKKLTLPSQMGEIVKVMALSKGLEIPLLGFTLHDRRRDL